MSLKSRFIPISLLIIPNAFYAFRIAIVGNNPVSNLAAIALKQKGFYVKIFEEKRDSYPIEKSKTRNVILNSRGILPLVKLGINIDSSFTKIKHIFRHAYDGSVAIEQSPFSFSIDIHDLNYILIGKTRVMCIDRSRSEFESADLSRNILYFGHGSEKFDLVVGADGNDSRVRSFLEREFPGEFFSSVHESKKRVKRIVISSGDMKKINGYDESWRDVVHVWKSGGKDLVCVPSKEGIFTGSYISSDDFDCETFPELFRSLEWFKRKDFKEKKPIPLRTLTPSHVGFKNVMLLGDAAHQMTSSLTQGLNCGFEDCFEMLMCVDKSVDIPFMVEKFNRNRLDDVKSACILARSGSSDSKWIRNDFDHQAHQYVSRYDISYSEILKIISD